MYVRPGRKLTGPGLTLNLLSIILRSLRFAHLRSSMRPSELEKLFRRDAQLRSSGVEHFLPFRPRIIWLPDSFTQGVTPFFGYHDQHPACGLRSTIPLITQTIKTILLFPVYIFSGTGIPRSVRPLCMVVTNAFAISIFLSSNSPPIILFCA